MSTPNRDRLNAAFLSAAGRRGTATCDIEGLWPDLPTASTVLRIAWSLGELDGSDCDDDEALNRFFDLLQEVEEDVRKSSRCTRRWHKSPSTSTNNANDNDDNSPACFLVAVEGLDGSGKSTLVRNLAEGLKSSTHQSLPENIYSCATPSKSLSAVRPAFDRCGGPVARAFYMCSNYVLQHEIGKACQEWQDARKKGGSKPTDSSLAAIPVFIVDRFYSSTCAYTVGWKNTSGSPADSIDNLPNSLFEWPPDLRPPDLMLVLDINDDTRRERVTCRAEVAVASGRGVGQFAGTNKDPPPASRHNPWDERLSNDAELGRRIVAAHHRIIGPLRVETIDANGSPDEVSEAAQKVVRDSMTEKSMSLNENKLDAEAFVFASSQNPLEAFGDASARLGMCDAKSGRRLRHAPWAFQLALATKDDYPNLRTVGIHTADSAIGGILFFSRGHPGGTGGGDEDRAAMIWCGGEYPVEQQWRAEGFVVRATNAECELVGLKPPLSLLANFAACRDQEQQGGGSASIKGGKRASCVDGTSYQTNVVGIRETCALANDDSYHSIAKLALAARFVPLRMEVLIGGPSSPGGPRRYEWARSLGRDETDGWTDARPILPFSPEAAITPGPASGQEGTSAANPRPITVSITGSHCSGKRTLGERLASILGWTFDPELGDLLRNPDTLIADGHTSGDGSGGGGQGWDAFVHQEECRRDQQTDSGTCSRVVETWHIGNLAWALQRGSAPDESQAKAKAENAIREEMRLRSVLLVHLQISPDTSIRRRRQEPDNASRLPMTDEVAECTRLHEALDVRGLELLRDIERNFELPLLVLNNDADGKEAMDGTVKQIIESINRNHWRRVINTQLTQ